MTTGTRIIVRAEEWAQQAACAGHKVDLWFSGNKHDEPRAKLVCGRCPVLEDCLEYALARRERFGIWGGLNEQERRRILADRLEARSGR